MVRCGIKERVDPAKSALANIIIVVHWSFLCFVSFSFFIITQHNPQPLVLWCCFSACPTRVSTCFTVKSSPLPRFSPTTVKPPPTVAEGTQVMSMDEGSPNRALIVYQANLDDEFDIDLRDDTSGRGPKPIKELVKLQLGPKLG